MTQIYCPYTDCYHDENDMNSEHIIPLSLGGANGFEIPVNREVNSKVGSAIDGRLANDFLLNLKRTKLEVKGHSKKSPSIISKSAYLDECKTKVRLEINRKEGIKLWDPIEKSSVDFTSQASFKNVTDFNVLKLARIRFIAKTALSAGYFVYGDKFRENVKHDELRTIMNFDGNYNTQNMRKLKTTVDYQFSEEKSAIVQAFKFVSSVVGENSSVGLILLKNTLAIFVGILGDYIGMVNVPCEISAMPNDKKYRWGRYICVQEGQPIISSWERMVDRIGKCLKSNNANAADAKSSAAD